MERFRGHFEGGKKVVNGGRTGSIYHMADEFHRRAKQNFQRKKGEISVARFECKTETRVIVSSMSLAEASRNAMDMKKKPSC